MFNFGEAIRRLKKGERVARQGWNGKGMFIFLVNGNIPADQKPVNGVTVFNRRDVTRGDELEGISNAVVLSFNGVSAHLFDIGDDGTVVRMPHLAMRAADGSTVTGWLASQTDMLAEDWTMVE